MQDPEDQQVARSTAPPMDPPAPDAALLRLAITEIQPCEHNPRRGENPEYLRIKASIRTEGLEQPLLVTRRPGETRYRLYAGGDTRLRILHELYAETGDARFADVSCVYRPWPGETDVLLAHLRANDLRGALSFLDKARAVQAARQLIARAQGTGELAQVALADALRACGYGLSQGLISHLLYAVERLLPLIPHALQAGMGRRQVERIRQLERAGRALWLERSVDTGAEYDLVFATLCRRYDQAAWDSANLRRALEAEIADRLDTSIQVISMALEGQLAGSRAVSSDQAAEPPPVPPRAAQRGNTHRPVERDAAQAVEPTRPPGPATGPTDRKSLRARAWTLASRLAQRNGLGELIAPLAGKGLGFVLTDVPDPALVDQLDEAALAQVSMVWWMLAAVSEMTVAPVDQLLPALNEASVLRQALQAQDAGLLFASVWTLDPGHLGYRLWRRLDDRDWQDLLALMTNYRALHRNAAAAGEPLWP